MADSVLNLASAEALLVSAVERVRADSTNTTTTTDSSRSGGEEESDYQHHHRTERLLAESKGLAALVGALSLDPSAALAALSLDSESVSDSHKNAKNTLLAAGQSASTAAASDSSSSVASAVVANQAAAAAAAALEGIVVDDSLMADVTEEMLEINAFDLLRSLERQASQLQAEADTIAAAAAAAVTTQQTASADEDDDEDDDQDEDEAVQRQQRPQAAVSSSSMMSVSVPNLCVSTSVDGESRHSHTGRAEGGSSPSSAGSAGSSGSTPTAFLESFANVARRRHQAGSTSAAASASSNTASAATSSSSAAAAPAAASGGGTNRSAQSVLYPRGPNSVSSLVRLALSSNFPGGLLSTAQSYPSLSQSQSQQHHHPSSSSSGGGQSSAAAAAAAAAGLSQALSMSLTSSDSEQVSLEDFLESCRAGTLLAELEDDDELPEPDEVTIEY